MTTAVVDDLNLLRSAFDRLAQMRGFTGDERERDRALAGAINIPFSIVRQLRSVGVEGLPINLQSGLRERLADELQKATLSFDPRPKSTAWDAARFTEATLRDFVVTRETPWIAVTYLSPDTTSGVATTTPLAETGLSGIDIARLAHIPLDAVIRVIVGKPA